MMNQTRQRGRAWRSLLIAGTVFALSGCASIATETGYVFSKEDAVDNPSMKDPFCAHKREYKEGEPAYYAELNPERDLTVRLQMLAPRINNHHGVGPGVLVPLPLLPDPVGNSRAAYYHNSPAEQFDKVVIAVYPEPFRRGYFFTPAQVRLDLGKASRHPVRVERHYSVNPSVRKQERGIAREKLSAQSGEFDAWILEFDVKGIATEEASLHLAGFENGNQPVAVRDLPLQVNKARVFDWKYDTDCNL